MVSIRDFGPIDSIYLAHSTDEGVRFRASSGAFVKSFLVYLLESGTVDFAIITRTGGPDNPLVPETIITNSREDILSTRTNSVYAPNNPFRAFNRLDPAKTYAFVGLPCHVRGLRALQKRGKCRNVIIVIGLFCHHTPGIEFTRDVLRKLKVAECDVQQIEYRGNGWPGGFTVYLKDGQKKFIASHDYWSEDLNNGPKACRYCSEMAREAHLLVGDPWNLGLERTDSKGTSLVICRNRQATALVTRSAEQGYVRVYPCSEEQLIQSQKYHIADKLQRGASRRPPMAKRLLNLLLHPRYAAQVALFLLNPALNRLRRARDKVLNWDEVSRLRKDPDPFTSTYIVCAMPAVAWALRRIYANRVLIWYWREERRYINFGEYIVPLLMEALGYKTVTYSVASSLGILPRYDFCLILITSELHKSMVDWWNVPHLYVWGGGKGRGEFFDIRSEPYASKVKIFAVRGPHTIRQLKLDEKTTVGDPGFLMPLFFRVNKDPRQHKVTYVPHWSNREDWEAKRLAVGAERVIDVRCTRKEFWSRLTAIVSSKFVLTNTLHTAVMCHAYGTPWALCLPEGDILDCPDKWRDLFELLGIYDKARAVKGYAEGLEWWHEVGSKAKTIDLLALLDSFPLPIKTKEALGILSKLKSGPPRS